MAKDIKMNTVVIKHMPKRLSADLELYYEMESKINSNIIHQSELSQLFDCFEIYHRSDFDEQLITYIIKLANDCQIIYDIFPKDIANIINSYLTNYIQYTSYIFDVIFTLKTRDLLNSMRLFEIDEIISGIEAEPSIYDKTKIISKFNAWLSTKSREYQPI